MCVCVSMYLKFHLHQRKEKIEVSIFALICIDPLSVREQVDTKRATKTVPFLKKNVLLLVCGKLSDGKYFK